MKSILIANVAKGLQTAIYVVAKKFFDNIVISNDNSTILSDIEEHKIDVLVMDFSFNNGIENKKELFILIKKIREMQLEVGIIALTNISEADLGVEAVNNGTFDFFIKPWSNEKLLICMQNAYKYRTLKNELEKIKLTQENSSSQSNYYWGTSNEMRKYSSLIQNGIKKKSTIHITGEGGTGKRALAKEIHYMFGRGSGVFLELDANLLSEEELNVELNNLKKRNSNSAIGRIEFCKNVSLYLSNIEKISNKNQLLLLEIINNNIFNELSYFNSSNTSLILISSSSVNLGEINNNEIFDLQLYKLLSGVKIELPELNEREEDIFGLAQMFLQSFSKKYSKKIVGFGEDAKQALYSYNWRGNIAELKITIERAVIVCDTDYIESHLILPNNSMGNINTFISSKYTLEKMEKKMIRAAIKRCNGNISKAAKQLGVTRQTLYNKGKGHKLF